ncbi:hypothetical protein L2E82_49537 [Cichorium intybus]|uniref:Uncharacterized protein n=1 Tax=Cichorium intybus TaxID=13427 RepID=A0ACB8Z212_CICIN|nr:hypothetical protein L2E82_49537 [Cichorium intybus]
MSANDDMDTRSPHKNNVDMDTRSPRVSPSPAAATSGIDLTALLLQINQSFQTLIGYVKALSTRLGKVETDGAGPKESSESFQDLKPIFIISKKRHVVVSSAPESSKRVKRVSSIK